ncbi:MAG: hypothetical protein EBU90_08245 [Proteobacteria bacterium]|nr:hypothetical protein [Pseudomonadota bacterium]NBP15634.1 hypothetical protein [bacterium]
MNKINLSSIRQKALNSNKLEKKADLIIENRLNIAKKDFLEEFDNHPITQELAGKNSSPNLSNTLDGKGNLFTFIGFDRSSDPIENLRQIIKNNFSYKKKKDSKKLRYVVSSPSMDKIRRYTPMPWEGGRSWVEAIEKGISGLSYYLYKKSKKSRSGNGIQAENQINSSSYKPKRYLTEIMEKFKKNLTK